MHVTWLLGELNGSNPNSITFLWSDRDLKRIYTVSAQVLAWNLAFILGLISRSKTFWHVDCIKPTTGRHPTPSSICNDTDPFHILIWNRYASTLLANMIAHGVTDVSLKNRKPPLHAVYCSQKGGKRLMRLESSLDWPSQHNEKIRGTLRKRIVYLYKSGMSVGAISNHLHIPIIHFNLS